MARKNGTEATGCMDAPDLATGGWQWWQRRAPGQKAEAQMRGPNAVTLLPWLLMGMGSVSNLIQGETPNPWIGGVGLLAFNSLYITVVTRAFHKERRQAPSTRWLLVAMGLVTCGLAVGYGGSWLMFYPLLGLAIGAVLRGRSLGYVMMGLTTLAGLTAGAKEGWDAVGIAYGTFISGMVTAAILALHETVKELRATREELARTAVERERLRFSRDLHDLLGHTLSVIVVKSEAARRIASRNLDAALGQLADIESVGRQALTEIREAVTGYREGSLSTELDRACSALRAADIEPAVHRSGPPLTAQYEALLGWVVREAVTNAVRYSAADRCVITVTGDTERVRLQIADNGKGAGGGGDGAGHGGESAGGDNGGGVVGAAVRAIGGTGLKGLTERLAAAGGSLVAGPAAAGGFLVTAELPVESADGAADTADAGAGAGAAASVSRAASRSAAGSSVPAQSASAAGTAGRDGAGGVMLKK
nr:histidine kinase [Streptomyces sp. ODS25]